MAEIPLQPTQKVNDAEPEDWRARVLFVVERTLMALGTLAILISLPPLLREGSHAAAACYLAAACFYGWFVFGARVGFRTRLTTMVVLAQLTALPVILLEGRLADFGLYLFGPICIAALLGGVRLGALCLGLALLSICSVGSCYVLGWWPLPPPEVHDLRSAGNWVMFAAPFLMFGGTVCVSIAFIHSRMEAALRDARELSADLRAQVKQRDEAITARETAELNLVQSQKMEAVGRLASGVAHDFNNLLTAMMIGSDFALSRKVEDQAQHDALVGLQDAASQAARLTRQLLAFSRREVVQPRNMDLHALAEETRRIMRRLLSSDIDFEFLPSDDTLLCVLDETQFQQVLMNLCINARDAMPTGGQLWLRTRRALPAETADLPLAASPVGGYACVEVQDSGHGMDATTLRQVFAPFFTTKPVGKGTGLGLSTSQHVAQQSGGHLTAESAPGEGATFRLFLPLSDKLVDEMPVTSELGDYRGDERVLVVEDHMRIRALVCAALQDSGYRVEDAPNARVALEMIRAADDAPFDMLISDVVMPGQSGPEMVAQMAREGHQPEVLYCSGYTPDEKLLEAVSRGEANLLQKPFKSRALLSKMRSLLDARQARTMKRPARPRPRPRPRA